MGDIHNLRGRALMKREIPVTCTGTAYIKRDEIHPLQGSLKIRKREQQERMIKSILQHGFSFPVFIWNNRGHDYTLDGHGRLEALDIITSQGYYLTETRSLEKSPDVQYKIPAIPVVYITAKDINEAKAKLLKINSRYGDITRDGFQEFVKGIDYAEFEGIELKIVDVQIPTAEPEIKIPNVLTAGLLPDAEPEEQHYTPEILVPQVTQEHIDEVKDSLENREIKEIETIPIKCKHCGYEYEIRKSNILLELKERMA
jgi:hypothetical protein